MTNEPLPPGITPDDVAFAKQIIARCWIVAGLVMALPLERLDKLTADAETFGPILHPDIWRSNAAKIMQDRELIRVLAQLRRDVLVSNPNLGDLPDLEALSIQKRPALEAAFREIFGRRQIADIPPLVILTALVRYIARLAPRLEGR